VEAGGLCRRVSILAKVTIHFIGPLRIIFGVGAIIIEANSLNEVKAHVETHFGPVYREKFNTQSFYKVPSLWEHSQFLLNGRSLQTMETPVLKDGDRLDLLVTAAGG
jgi:hypothetical protein